MSDAAYHLFANDWLRAVEDFVACPTPTFGTAPARVIPVLFALTQGVPHLELVRRYPGGGACFASPHGEAACFLWPMEEVARMDHNILDEALVLEPPPGGDPLAVADLMLAPGGRLRLYESA